MEEEIFYQKVETKLRNRNSSESTIRLYLSGIKNFVKFCDKTDIRDINSFDLAKFSKSLFKNNTPKAGTIKPLKHGINLGFNEILNLNLDIDLLPTPKNIVLEKEYFTKEEISTFFSYITNVKHKTIFEFMYATGMEIKDIINIKITDINGKKKQVILRSDNLVIKRETYISGKMIENLRYYFNAYRPTKYLFEGRNKGDKISDRTILHAFNLNMKKVNLNKNLTTRSLKYSYIIHLTEDGIPLNSVLEHLNITNSETLRLYNNICFPIIKYNSSPFETLHLTTEKNFFFDTTDIEHVLAKIKDKEERDYLEEGIKCFKANALRAGVIFLWSASIYKIQKMCLTQSLGFINTELRKIYPKAKEIKVIEDFGYVNDKFLLELACNIKVLDKTKKEELKNTCLDLRNKCGHPGNYKPKGQKIKAFVEDIIGMLY